MQLCNLGIDKKWKQEDRKLFNDPMPYGQMMDNTKKVDMQG